MNAERPSLAARLALATVNAPLPMPIDEATLIACLSGRADDLRWSAHLRSFFEDVHADTIMDLVIEGALTWTQLRSAVERHGDEESDVAGWIREMAGEPLA